MKKTLQMIFVVSTISVFLYFPLNNFQQIESISYYFGTDVEKQLPGIIHPESFSAFVDDGSWILRVRWVKLTLWPGTGKIEAEMCFDLFARYGKAEIRGQWLWADSYENNPVESYDEQLYRTFDRFNPGFVNQLIIPLTVYTGAIDDAGYSMDFTFLIDYIIGPNVRTLYCVFALYFARGGSSYFALSSELGAFASPQSHLKLTS